MKKVFFGAVIIIAIAVSANYYYKNYKSKHAGSNVVTLQQSSKQPKADIKIPTTTPTTSPVASSSPVTKSSKPIKTYTMAEVTKHGSDPDNYVDCWTVIHDKVYDITVYADSLKHPGGEQIYQACGTDATTLFETRPTGSGTPHSETARKILEKYYIGDLQK